MTHSFVTTVEVKKPTASGHYERVVSSDFYVNEEVKRSIRDAIVSGVGFLMLTADALDQNGSININFKRINKEDVSLFKSP